MSDQQALHFVVEVFQLRLKRSDGGFLLLLLLEQNSSYVTSTFWGSGQNDCSIWAAASHDADRGRVGGLLGNPAGGQRGRCGCTRVWPT